jgi:hypothetical protein
MAINFPINPSAGQTFTVGNVTYRYTNSIWEANTSANEAEPRILTTREGLRLSKTGTYNLEIAPGRCLVSSASGNRDIAVLGTTTTKILNVAWAVGTANGGLDIGAISSPQTYHIYIIKRTDTGVVDVIASLSASAPTLPTGYTHYKRIGSILIRSNTILDFDQYGNIFKWKAVQRDLDNVAVPTTATLYALTVPTGINVGVLGVISPGVGAASGTGLSIAVTDPGQDDYVPANAGPAEGAFNSTAGSSSNSVYLYASATMLSGLVTNTTAQLRFRRTNVAYYNSSYQTTFQTLGYIDHALDVAGGSASGGGTGDIAGPSSSTDNAIARFDGTTGKLLQNSTNATLDDSGNLTLNAVGSTTANPRVLGFSQASTEACRFQIGNESVSINNVFGGVLQFRSYYGFQFFGQQQTTGSYTESGSNGYGPYSAFAAGSFSDPCHDFIRVQSTTSKAGAIVRLRRGETTNTNPYLSWVNNAGTIQGAITQSGGLSLGSSTDTALGSIRADGPVIFGTYTVATLPNAATWNGFSTIATDANAGFGAWVRSNGVNWIDLGYSRIVTTAAAPSGGGGSSVMQELVLPANSGFGPTSTTPARPDARNGQPVLAFDATTAWFWEWITRLPTNYNGNGLNVEILWTSAATGSGNVIWNGAFSQIQSGTTNLSSAPTYATAQAVTGAAPGTTGVAVVTTIPFTSSQISSAVAGEFIKFRLSRDAANVLDSLNGIEAQVFSIVIRGA